MFDVNCKAVTFLDVTMNIDTGLYCLFYKLGKTIQYINACSNHLESTIRGIVMAISVRPSNVSSNREIFEQQAPVFNDTLKLSGFKEKVSFLEDTRFKIKLNASGDPSDPGASCTLAKDNGRSLAIIVISTL